MVDASASGAGAIAIPLRWLGGSRRDEPWFGDAPVLHEHHDDLALVDAGELLCGVLDVAERGPLEPIVTALYARVLDECTQRGFPHLLRFWNFFGAINSGDGDAERYRRFCVGRAQVLSSAPAEGYPAATAIGIPGPSARVQVVFMATRRAGEGIENLRQTSAWNYPREFGPVAPGFSRAMLLPWLPDPLLLVSGTASVVGHATVHSSTATQLEEALRNVGAVVDAAAARLDRPLAMGRGGALRVYLRDAAEAPGIAAQLAASLPPDLDWMLLHGDICRADLRVELELRQQCVPRR